jgi:hypothetical protein
MVFNGNTSGPAYTATLLPGDTLINLIKTAQASLRVKLVRPQVRQHVGINKQLIGENEEQAARTKAVYNGVWMSVVNSMRKHQLDADPIFNAMQQREWDRNEKLLQVVTNLVDIPDRVLNYERDLFARLYDIESHSMSEPFMRELREVPRFKELKFYYNCNLNRDEYVKLGHITEIKYNTPRTSLPQSTPIIHTARMHNRVGGRVDNKTNILTKDELPTVCRPFNVIVRPDAGYNWNAPPFNAHDNLHAWLGRHRDDYLNIQSQWQFVHVNASEGEYPINPLTGNVASLPQFVRFWQYYLPDNKKEILVVLFHGQFLTVTIHNYLMKIFKGNKNFNYI